jgi:cupin 2 domain-containing protein
MNPLSKLPKHLPETLATVLQEGTGVRTQRIDSRGRQSSECYWYDQSEQERVLVLTGAAELQFEDRVVELLPGDYVNIPGRQKHRVAWTTPDGPGPTVWLAVY